MAGRPERRARITRAFNNPKVERRVMSLATGDHDSMEGGITHMELPVLFATPQGSRWLWVSAESVGLDEPEGYDEAVRYNEASMFRDSDILDARGELDRNSPGYKQFCAFARGYAAKQGLRFVPDAVEGEAVAPTQLLAMQIR